MVLQPHNVKILFNSGKSEEYIKARIDESLQQAITSLDIFKENGTVEEQYLDTYENVHKLFTERAESCYKLLNKLFTKISIPIIIFDERDLEANRIQAGIHKEFN